MVYQSGSLSIFYNFAFCPTYPLIFWLQQSLDSPFKVLFLKNGIQKFPAIELHTVNHSEVLTSNHCYRFHSTLSYFAELASAFFTLVHEKCFHEHLGQNSSNVHASPAGVSKAFAKLILWRNGKALQFSTDPAGSTSQSLQMQQDNWAKLISADKRAIRVPTSSFLFLHLLHQNNLGR